jgi:TatD DNase family protein
MNIFNKLMGKKGTDEVPASTQFLFDTHCHFNDVVFDKDRDSLMNLANQVGVKGMLLPGTTKESWRKIRQLSSLHKNLHCALGLHPFFVDSHQKNDLRSLELAVATPPISAIGEIGLDFQVKELDKQKQVVFFRSQLQIANVAHLPVVLHVRKAHDEVLKQLRIINFRFGGFVHAFNGSMEQAKRYIDLGFKLGFGGAMTFPRAVKIRNMASELPLNSIVIETDAPDMKPITCQGNRNTPVHLVDNFKTLCELRYETPSKISQQTTENACQILDISISDL